MLVLRKALSPDTSRRGNLKFGEIIRLPSSTPEFPNGSKFCLIFKSNKARAKARKSSLNYCKT